MREWAGGVERGADSDHPLCASGPKKPGNAAGVRQGELAIAGLKVRHAQVFEQVTAFHVLNLPDVEANLAGARTP